MSRWATLISSGFGSGYSPIAPGTVGTLVGIGLLSLFPIIGMDAQWDLFIALIFFCLLAYCAIIKLPNNWIHDDQRIVSDEIAGVWLTMLWVPITIQNVLMAFVLFRFFDILKPLGIRYFDRWNNDLGVLVDDLLAGIYANICLRLILIFL